MAAGAMQSFGGCRRYVGFDSSATEQALECPRIRLFIVDN